VEDKEGEGEVEEIGFEPLEDPTVAYEEIPHIFESQELILIKL